MRFSSELLEATEEVCQRESLAARTRMALLRMEKDGHRSGWDTRPPTVWRLEYDPGRQYVHARPSSGITLVLLRATEDCGGDVGEGLMRTARVMEIARGQLGQAGVPRHTDVFDSKLPSHRFYGFALCHEAWTTRGRPTPSEAVAGEAKRLHQHPDRVEARMVNLAARDGLIWWAVRLRREPPVQVAMWRPEADTMPGGLVYHALARMTASMVGNVVPVPPLTDDALREAR